MGFRDPIMTISGDDITPGTITGSSFQTAAAGRRVVLSSDPARAQSVEFYTGRPTELDAGIVAVSVGAQGTADEYPVLDLVSPRLCTGADDGRPAAWISLRGSHTGGFNAGAEVDVNAPLTWLSGALQVQEDAVIAGDLHVGGLGGRVYGPTTPKSGRQAITVTGVTGVDTALTSTITFPIVAEASRYVVTALGKSGNVPSLRTTSWEFDSNNSAGGCTMSQDPAIPVTIPTSTWGTIVQTATIDVPAGIAGTCRLVYRSNASGINSGAVTWHRSGTS